MPNPINIFVFSTKQRAHQESEILIEEGFDVILTGPTTDLFTTRFNGNQDGQDIADLQSPFNQNWVVLGFNKTVDDVVDID